MREPARILGLRLSEILHAHLKVLAIRIHSSNHHFVAKHELKIDLVSGNLDFPIAAGDTRQHQHAVLPERLHAVENDGRETGCFKDDVKWSVLLCAFEN